jgi:LPS-assembly protein
MIRRLSFLQSVSRLSLTALVFAFAMPVALVRAQETDAKSAEQSRTGPLQMQAEQMKGRPDRELNLTNDVQVRRGDMQIESDRMHYDIVEDKIDAEGNVEIERAGDHYRGTELHLKMDTGAGYMNSPVYKLIRKNAQGKAKRIDFESQDAVTIYDGIFTTCDGPDPDWYLKSSKLSLDNARETGAASNAVLVFKGVPIVGTPHISFPMSEQRASGFLAPTVATSTNGGLEIITPYYLDIAPNRDLTLFPHYIARRGMQLGAEGRYLGESYKGETRGEIINDESRNGEQRYALRSVHQQELESGIILNSNLNFASDNDYPRDFPIGRTLSRTPGSRRLLLRDLQMSYQGEGWNGAIRASEYQVLQDPNIAAKITQPYARLPQITYSLYGFTDKGFDWSVDSELTRFTHLSSTVPIGDRLVVKPRIGYAWNQPSFFVRSNLTFHSVMYSLEQADSAMKAPSIVVPTFSVDAGTVLERDASFFGSAAIQTLEPRVFYSFTPYRQQDQNLYPNFDTSEADFNFAQVFRDNRFIGNDRIGDSNQITTALISRFLEINGQERLKMALAQRFYFSDQRVTLTDTTVVASNDLLLLSSGRVSDTLRVDANFQYSQSQNEVNRISVGSFWQPKPMHLLNLQYRRDLRYTGANTSANFELVDMAAQWPLTNRLYGVGRLNFQLEENKISQALMGLEYKADCWIFRFVGQRIPTAAGSSNTIFYVQLEFNGLSSLGQNPMRALRSNVPGYQPLNQQD